MWTSDKSCQDIKYQQKNGVGYLLHLEYNKKDVSVNLTNLFTKTCHNFILSAYQSKLLKNKNKQCSKK